MWKRGEAECMVHFVHCSAFAEASNKPHINVLNANSLWSTDSQRIAFGCLLNVCHIDECCLPHLGNTFTLTRLWPYEFDKPQWPYHSLSDRVFFLRHFTPGRHWPYHGLTDRFFFSIFFYQVFDLGRQWSYHSLRLVFFHFFSSSFSILNIKDHDTTQSVRPWYGHWRHPGVKCLRKKTRSVRPWYGHWQTRLKAWLKKMTRSVRQRYGHRQVKQSLGFRILLLRSHSVRIQM